MRLLNLIVLGAMILLPLGAQAQWQWVDKDNKKVFSDQAPPPDIPDSSILHRPAAAARRAAAAPAAEATASNTQAAPLAPATPKGVDKSLQEKARKAEEDEKAKQKAEADRLAQAQADNCKRARQSKATLDSGIRLAQVNAQGERIVMDDAARAAEQQRAESVIASDCK
jgi:hypothetical protein